MNWVADKIPSRQNPPKYVCGTKSPKDKIFYLKLLDTTPTTMEAILHIKSSNYT